MHGESKLSFRRPLVERTCYSLQFYIPASNIHAMADEQLKCNICGVTVSASQSKQHALSSSHDSRRSELEQKLEAIRKESYKDDDSSVIFQWKSSI